MLVKVKERHTLRGLDVSKFWLMRMRQVKCCTFLHGNCIKNLLQCQKVHFYTSKV